MHPNDEGTPQGGSISVLLSNVYLHYVLDLWFDHVVKPRLLLYLRLFPRRFPEVFRVAAGMICRIVRSGDDLRDGERERFDRRVELA